VLPVAAEGEVAENFGHVALDRHLFGYWESLIIFRKTLRDGDVSILIRNERAVGCNSLGIG